MKLTKPSSAGDALRNKKETNKYMIRPVIKGLSWRAFAAFDTMIVTGAVMFFRTGTLNVHAILNLALGIVGMELVTKTFLFTVHEKLWERERASEQAAAVETRPSNEELLAAMDEQYANRRIGWAVE